MAALPFGCCRFCCQSKPDIGGCGFCCQSKPDIGGVCNSCFTITSEVISSTSKLEDFQTVDSHHNNKQHAAYFRINLLRSYLVFSSEYAAAFTDQSHTDILLKPGQDNGTPIPAHKALLAAKSIVFKNMFDSEDICDELLTFPEMNYEELKTFLEFLYYGKLSTEVVRKHASSLFSAARKYEIPFLEMFLVFDMFQNLKVENVLEVIEIASTCFSDASSDALMYAAKRFIRNNTSIVFSPGFEAFATKNPSLAVKISRDLVKNLQTQHPT